MVGLPLRNYVFLLLTVGMFPELVLSLPSVIMAFADNTRLVGYIHFENSTRTECFVYSSSGNVLPVNEEYVKKKTASEIDNLITNCSKLHEWPAEHTRREKRTIFPGTKWCGVGNIAGSYSDLGKEKDVDMCCRDHDHCKDFIPPFTRKYGLFNFSLFTRSHCNCDRKFKKCLKEHKLSDNISAAIIYNMFFKLMKMTCFEKKLDQVCAETWIFTCLKYQNVTTWTFSSP